MNYKQWIKALEQNVSEQILEPWLQLFSFEEDLIYSSADQKWNRYGTEPLTCVLVSRLLWTYARAYRYTGRDIYKKAAELAYRTLTGPLHDKSQGGFYWSVSLGGEIIDNRKHFYAQSFSLYGLAEYARINPDEKVLQEADHLFHLLMSHGWDSRYKGFIECKGKDWQPLNDQRLSPDEPNAAKSMNTNLHAMEALSNYLDICPSPEVKKALSDSLQVVMEHIVDPIRGHFKLFFHPDWSVIGDEVSYGHDIEGAWLIWEAAEKAADTQGLDSIRSLVLNLVNKNLEEGIDPRDGACLWAGNHQGVLSRNKDWWPQAEGMVGYLQGYLLDSRESYLEAARRLWDFIQNRMVDKQYRGWYWSTDAEGSALNVNKAGPWQCPYHNARACWESMDRIKKIEEIRADV